ncbi:DivIVA domain-containing protein [Dactylosporangium sp. NBC_01737]|uniref:DivIVA domain-containing protein n=1 Tax=Dactylosporangium sp. NBC_01737 TaxID=2975959 RepID=UPI002E1283DA|nr:DivIVA domain-containing protein [Dactylosporangium sp. NBC_01737]
MAEFLLVLIAAVVVGAIGFGVSLLITGDDPGIEGHEPDGRAVPLPSSRPLVEGDVGHVRFDTTLRGYRMAQVDAALRRAGYDIGYKEELIQVLEAEVKALRDGRTEDADALRDAREAAVTGAGGTNVVTEKPETPADAAVDLDKPVDLDKSAAEDGDAPEDGAANSWGLPSDETWGSPSPVVK